jgi:electron transfer flavoprotein beta subunit
VASPFDLQAIELALRLRDRNGDVAIALLCLGAESARAMLKRGLALGADEAFLVCDPACDDGDSFTTARVLAAAIARIGGVDLVLAGRQAADTDSGVVGCGIAELLSLPAVTCAYEIATAEPGLTIERALADGSETIEAALPCVVTVSHEVGAVRSPSLRETMKAARKPLTVWSAADLGLERSAVGAAGALRAIERLYVPASDVHCEFIGGESAEELARNLLERLDRAGLVGPARNGASAHAETR